MKLKDIFSINNLYKNKKKYGKLITLFGKQYAIASKTKLINNLEIISNAKNCNDYISIVAIAKNEGPYIKEWIEYHKLIGVERFYFYDNESNDATKEVLKPYIEDGTVVYHYVKGKCMQMPVYEDAITRYKNNTHWMAYIDLDEFIVPVEKYSLKDFLKDYEKYPGIVINWTLFDSNGLKNHPEDKLVIEAYTRTSKNLIRGNHVKSIINPKLTANVQNPHAFIYKHFKFAVTENYKEVYRWPFCYVESYIGSKIRINHYYSKSLEDYEKKVNRGFADQTTKREAVYAWVNFSETTNDYTIQKYVPELRKKMGLI